MRALILCPGPSLAGYKPDRTVVWEYDVRIAVNLAVCHSPVDWWVCLDGAGFAALRRAVPDGRKPKLLIAREAGYPTRDDESAMKFWGGLVWHIEDVVDSFEAYRGPPQLSTTYSSLAAIILAVQLGAKEIHVVGADMKGEKDFLGGESGNRGTDRWNRERDFLARVIHWAGGHGADVTLSAVPLPA